MPKKKKDEEVESALAEEVIETAVDETAVEAAADVASPAVETATEEVGAEAAPAKETKPKKAKAAKVADSSSDVPKVVRKRAEKVGIVASDKMTKTVTVRVDRLVKHPLYHKYVKKRKKFMAHDDLGAKIGDKVRIIETRPLSARKRWRVVEILHKAEV